MRFNTILENFSELELIRQSDISEVILEHKLLSRLGKLTSISMLSLLSKVLSYNLSPVLQWDILCTDRSLRECLTLIKELPLDKFSAIRVQDLGVAEWLRTEHPEIPLQLVVESANHNITGLLRWTEYFGKQLDRLVLSTEIPKTLLIEYSKILTVPCEILAVGRILLFYSPRKLLSAADFKTKSSDFFEKKLITEDQIQHQFPTIQNNHGTFMFHHRDLFLLDYLPELKQTHIDVLRFDLRHLDLSINLFNQITDLIKSFDKTKCDTLKSAWPSKITHGFFRANRTDLAINRIKNPHLKDRGETLVGYVVEAVKGKHLIILTRKAFPIAKVLTGITPEGRELEIATQNIKNTDGQHVSEIISGKLYQIPHVKYVTPQSLIYNSFD